MRVIDPLWAPVFAEFESDLKKQGQAPDARFFKTDQAPFDQLSSQFDYIEWQDLSGIRHLAYQHIRTEDFADQSIPDALRIPMREHWPALLCVALLIGYWGFFHRQKLTLIESSTSAQIIRCSGVLIAIGVGLIWGPLLCQFDFLLSLFSGIAGMILLMVAGPMIWIGRRKIALLRSLVDEQRYLAHFTYGTDEWRRYADWNFSEEMALNKSIWWTLFVTILVSSLIFLGIAENDNALWIVGFLSGGFMLLVTVLAFVLPAFIYQRNCAHSGEAYIGRNIIYFNGSVHFWGTPDARLELMEFKSEPLPHLLLIYSQRQTMVRPVVYTYRANVSARIPVPAGLEKQVQCQVIEPLMQGYTSVKAQQSL